MEYRILKENEIKEAIELVARVAKKDIYKDLIKRELIVLIK